jgi:hypothetical protein
MPRLRLLPFLLLLSTLPAAGQEGPRNRFETARLDWDAGRYIEALTTLEALLHDPSPDLEEEIALLTGELFDVSEITPDGRGVRWSPTGKLAAYQRGAGGAVETFILELGEGGLKEVGRVRGSGLVFSPVRDAVAYLALDETSELREARAKLREEIVPTDRASFMRLRASLASLDAEHTRIVVRDLAAGGEVEVQTGGVAVQSLLYRPGSDELFLLGNRGGDPQTSHVWRVRRDGPVEAVTRTPGPKTSPFFAAGGSVLVYGSGAGKVAVTDLESGDTRTLEGSRPVTSADGLSLAFVRNDDGEGTVTVLPLREFDAVPKVVARVPFPVAEMTSQGCPSCPVLSGLSFSPDGSTVAFQAMPREDWELFLVSAEGGEEGGVIRFTREIQHDLFPQFLRGGRLLATKGEGRHRRAFLFGSGGEPKRLFRNNTLRTVAPEYEWAPSPDGTKLLIVAERDGNTVSPERGVYLLDLSRKVTREDLLARIRRNLKEESALLARAKRTFAPLAQEIRSAVGEVSVPRLFRHEQALFRFGSKHISQPGNRMAIDYLVSELRGFGHEPELQWFDARGYRSANVVVRIPGNVSPDVVYAVSAHFDSNNRSPGADDNTSATVGLLEMARVLSGHPLPATVEIAFFTGEEAGLLGSREYVRRAVESGKVLVGALNNDMVGWAENHRLDNTIRYSNDGIRDVQHGAAILFSDLVTYDAKYYKSTDAAAYFDAFGDIVGGIGSYPILANPHYHQVHDVLETVNHQLVAEVAKVTVASAILLASSPSRLNDLVVREGAQGFTASWTPAVESDVTGYIVRYGPPSDPERHHLSVPEAEAVLPGAGSGTVVLVKAVNSRGLEGWDWARTEIGNEGRPLSR